MTPISTAVFAKALWPGVKKWYGKSYAEFATEYDKIYATEKSTKAWEEYVSISSFGLAQQKPESEAISYDIEQQGFIDRAIHATYGLGFGISKELIEDNQYQGTASRKAADLAYSMRQTKEVLAMQMLNRAFNSTYTFGDGKELIATDHPNVAGGTWSNELAVAADISEAALEQACIDIGKYTNDRGLRIAVRPMKIVVPVDLDFEINKIMQTEYEVGTNNNTKNVVRSRFPGGVIVNHYLTDTDAWFILTNVPNGMTYLERRADTFSMDEDFTTDNALYKATARYSFICVDKKQIYGSAGA
jgi:phage major head subunit gpT-like protein